VKNLLWRRYGQDCPVLEFWQGTRLAEEPTRPLVQWVATFLAGVKGLWNDNGLSPPSSVEFENEWNCALVLPICPHRMDRAALPFEFN